ncbi:MAG: hypothetical protein IPO36_21465 [Anaerolineales bacterium]|nr:hypothetical protein [Anaerolineales bacterium]
MEAVPFFQLYQDTIGQKMKNLQQGDPMQRENKWSMYGRIFFSAWATLCVALFVLFSGRASVLHGSLLFNWEIILPKLSRIEPINYLADIIGAFFGVAFFFLACTSLGTIFTSLLWDEKSDISNKPARPILIGSAFLIGSGLFSIIFLTLGGLYKLTPAFVIAITLGGLVLGLRSFVKFIKTHAEDHSFNLFEGTDNNARLVYGLSLGILLLSLMYSSSRLSYDSVALYFSDAKITAMTNHIQYFLNDSFIASSFHTGIQYAAIAQIFGDQAARLYSWANGFVIIIFTLALGEQLGLSKQARRILLALLLTTTAFTDLLGDGKIDLAASAPAVAAVYWMVVNGIKARNSGFFFVGFLAGFAIISRPFNAVLLGIFFALFYLQEMYSAWKNDGLNLKSLFSRFFWLLSALLGLALFHLAANWMILGDPLAAFTNAAKLNTSGWQWSFDPNEIWAFRAFYPFVVTFLNSPQSLGTISPLFLAFFPGVFIKNVRERLFEQKTLLYLTSLTLITLLLWIMLFFTVVEIRYVFFLWIILFMPLAVIAEGLFDLKDDIGKIMKLMLVVVLLFVNFRVIYISLDTYSPLDSRGNPQCNNYYFCDYLKPINDQAALGERVLTLSAFRYYLRSDLFACSTKADEYSVLRAASLRSTDEFWEEAYRQGYTYVAYEKNYTVRHLYMDFVPSPDNIPSWMSLMPIYGNSEDYIVAYKINVHTPPVFKTKTCMQDENRIWEVVPVASK